MRAHECSGVLMNAQLHYSTIRGAFKKKNYEILDMWQKGGGSAAQANFLTKKSLDMCSGGGVKGTRPK